MRPIAVVATAVAVLAGCTVGQKKTAVEAATASDEQRRQLFEATLRALDEKPEYVDEFFALALKHRPTLHRFVQDTAGELHEEWLARMTARELADAPPSLRQIMVETLAASAGKPKALDAISAAIGTHPATVARALAARPEVLEKATAATVDVVAERPETRDAMRRAMVDRREVLGSILAEDPGAALELVKAFASAATKDDPLLGKLRRALE